MGIYLYLTNEAIDKEAMTVSNYSSTLFLIIIILAPALFVAGFILITIARRRSLGSGLILSGFLAAAVSLSFFMFTISANYFSQPESCILCHEMNPEYNTWNRSAHKRITCLACHTPVGGASSFIGEEWAALGEVVAHFTGDYPKIINSDSHVAKDMKSGVCERCHDMKTRRGIKTATEIKINHEEHLGLGMTCTACHNRVTHSGASGYPYFNGMKMMQGCMRCHQPGRQKRLSGRTAPAACGVCHRQPDFAQDVFGKGKIEAADFERCRDCHRIRDPKLVTDYDAGKMGQKEVDCSDCHGRHDKEFVLDPPLETCTDCHEDAADDVISGKMGFKDYKQPFKTADKVRCGLCHPSHGFKAKRP